MSYTTPDHRKSAVLECLDLLRGGRRIILTTHQNADGDGAGCEVALVSWIRAVGGEAWIVNPTPFPDPFRFLLEDESWVVSATSQRARSLTREADLAVVLDTGETHRIGRMKPLLDHLPKAVIDHHPPGNAPIPGASFRDPGASATGELVYDLIQRAQGPWTPQTVDGLYVAILTDTGSFRFANSTPAAHRIAADLVQRGADPEDLYRRVYGDFPLRRLHLLRASLGELGVSEDGRVAWMTVPRDAYEELGATGDDLEGLVDYPRSLKGVEVGILFRKTPDQRIKISFRSNGEVDVNELARRFDGGGHVKASGAMVRGRLDEVREEVLGAAADAVEKTLGMPGTVPAGEA